LRWIELTDDCGQLLPIKAEGLCEGPDGVLYVVLDPDAPDRPSELCRLALAGPWN
jgi:hypothetical protein